MTLGVSYPTDLEVRSDRTQIDRAFFNRRFKALYDELARLDSDFAHFGETEDTLVQLGLERINETLGPAMVTIQTAAELGFLTCRSIGDNHSLVLGEFVPWHITHGADLFTPTPFLLAMDEGDQDNWGILQVDEDGWHATTGELSTHVVYSHKTQTSTTWSISANAAMMPAMQEMLNDANTAKMACQTAQASVAAEMAGLEDLAAAIEAGPVASVAGRTGVVVLLKSDIAGLESDLSSKATTTFVTSSVAGKQDANAKLTVLANVAWAANRLLMATSGSTIGTLAISEFAKGLLDDLDLSETQSTLGISSFAKTLIDDVDAAAARATLGIAAAPEIPVKASAAEVATGTDDIKFATALGIAGTYLPKTAGINTQTGTSYTLVAADSGKIVRFTSASPVSCNLSASAVIGHNTTIQQAGAGQVTVNVVTNATRRSFASKFKLAGQNATASVFVEANSDGSHAEWNVSGNLVT